MMIIYNKSDFGIFIDNIRFPSRTKTRVDKINDTSKLLRLKEIGVIMVYDTIDDDVISKTPNFSETSDSAHDNNAQVSKKTNKKSTKKSKVGTINNVRN